MNSLSLSIMVLAAATLFASGCATTPPPTETAKPKTMSVEQISQQWKQGNDLVVKGEDARRKAQAKAEAANLELKEGDSMIARGKTLMLESEQSFRDTSRKTANN